MKSIRLMKARVEQLTQSNRVGPAHIAERKLNLQTFLLPKHSHQRNAARLMRGGWIHSNITQFHFRASEQRVIFFM